MPRQVVTYAATVPLSGTTSDPVAVVGAARLGVLFPAVTSATWYVQVSHTSSPADFRRVLKRDGSGDLTLAIGPGSRAVTVGDVAGAFPYVRLESGVPQAAAVTLTVVVKLGAL
jgi:hypothetical protein